jgi:hypothetical protein
MNSFPLQSGSVKLLICYIKSLYASGARVGSYAALQLAVDQCILNRNEILSYLKRRSCKLLAPSPLNDAIDVSAVDHLIIEGRAGLLTLSYLLKLEDEGKQFPFFSALVQAVRSRATRVKKRQKLRDYLESHASTFFAFTSIVEITDADIDAIIDACNGRGSLAMQAVRELLAAMRSFRSMAEMCDAVRLHHVKNYPGSLMRAFHPETDTVHPLPKDNRAALQAMLYNHQTHRRLSNTTIEALAFGLGAFKFLLLVFFISIIVSRSSSSQ